MNPTLKIALAYMKAGLGVMPIKTDGSKAPALQKGHNYLRVRATAEDLEEWFEGRTLGIAIACGKVSGNLECIDFETWDAFVSWRKLVSEQLPGLVAMLNICETPGHLGQPGCHVRYRLKSQVPGSTKLAADYQLDDRGKRKKDERGKWLTIGLIETRGEGGYAVAPGSPKGCHRTGKTWRHVQGPPLTELPVLTETEREVLIRTAMAMNKVPTEADAASEKKRTGSSADRLLPGDDYNRRGPDWPEILERHGWQIASKDGKVCRWRRPGKDHGWSATTGACRADDGTELFHVFTSNASPFEPGGSYSKFRVLALLEHKGDYRTAARALGEAGFGEKQVARPAAVGGNDKPGNPKQAKAAKILAQLLRPESAQIYELDALLAKQFDPLRWVVDGLVPDEGLTFLGGRKKLGKSWLCLQIAQAVATGANVLGKATQAGRVVYIVLEDGERRVKDRFIKQHASAGQQITLYTRLPPLDQLDGVGELIEVLEQKPRLVIIDTLAAAKTGKTDENAAGPMADLANSLRRLAQHYKVGVLVTHHHGKTVHGDPGDDMRGSSAIAAAGDVNLGMYFDGDRRARLKGEGRDIEGFDLALEFDPVHTWCWQLLGDGREISRQEADEAILAALAKTGQADAQTIADVAGKDRRSVAERLHRMASEGLIIAFEAAGSGKGRPRFLFTLSANGFSRGDAFEG